MKQTLNKLKVRNDFLNNLVTKLVEQRHIRNLTQEELNAILGVTDRLLGKWEAGIRTPTVFHLICWGEALDLRLNFDPANDNIPPEPDNQPPLVAANNNSNSFTK